MNLLTALHTLLGTHQAAQSQPVDRVQPQQQKAGHTALPMSALHQLLLGHQGLQNAQNPVGQQAQGGGFQQPLQGATNDGYTPLQNSGFGGPGYAANLQPAGNPQQQNPYLGY